MAVLIRVVSVFWGVRSERSAGACQCIAGVGLSAAVILGGLFAHRHRSSPGT